MPVLRLIRERFERERPLAGMRIGACLHVTTETANLMRTLAAGGAEVSLCASNPLSTKDDVAAALVVEYGISTFARRGEDRDTYYAHLNAVADTRPQLTMDDGCDLVSLLHKQRRDILADVLAGTEETTTGVIRLRAMAADGALEFPSTCSTTATAPASQRSTAFFARPTSCSPAGAWLSPAMAGLAVASRRGSAAWVRWWRWSK
jgi:adenosylhomocysteinase